MLQIIFLYFLGRILKVRGNKGEVIIRTSPDITVEVSLKKGQPLILKSDKHQKTKILEYHRFINGNVIVKFEEIHSIEDAYRLVGYSLYSRKKPQTGTMVRSLLDYTVKTSSGELWGKVFREHLNQKNAYLEVKNPQDNLFFVPLVDEIILKLDDEKKLILIDPPEGLKNINQ